MEWRTHTDIRQSVEFLKPCAARWESGEEFCWVITVKPESRADGAIACRVRGHAVDFGYVLNRKYWGQGYATEAARASASNVIGPFTDAFRQGMRELGYVEGKNFVLEIRGGGAELDRLSDLAAELVRLKVDIIVTVGSPALRAATKATRTIPIVMRTGADPVKSGHVASLARPGGNITGVYAMSGELSGIYRERVGQVSGDKIMKRYHDVQNVRFKKHYLLLTVDGRDCRIDLRQQSKKLTSADERTKKKFEVSPSGYGIHWPELDEDLSIDGMIKAAKTRKAG